MKEIMSDLQHWQTIDRRLLLDRPPWMRLFEDDVVLPDGRIVHGYLHLETPGFIMVVPVNHAHQIGLVRSYKRGVDDIDLQPPAGVIDPGEDPLACAQRELLEELGCQAERLLHLGTYVISGNYFAGVAHFYYGVGCRIVTEPNAGDLEEQEVIWLPHEEVHRMWIRGAFKQMSSAAALGLALHQLEELIAPGLSTWSEPK
jgi:ADP-ribose pyrophosphatase